MGIRSSLHCEGPRVSTKKKGRPDGRPWLSHAFSCTRDLKRQPLATIRSLRFCYVQMKSTGPMVAGAIV